MSTRDPALTEPACLGLRLIARQWPVAGLLFLGLSIILAGTMLAGLIRFFGLFPV